MSKISEFYTKATSDENSRTKLSEILGGKAINEADDEQLKKIGILAKELGFEITVDEAKKYLSNDNAELDDDDLEAVAGGTNKPAPYSERNLCIHAGNTFPDHGFGLYANLDTKPTVDK